MLDIDDVTKDLDLVLEYGEWGYSWNITMVWYDPHAEVFYWYNDSGCSCTYFGEGVTNLSQLNVGSKDACLRDLPDLSVEDRLTIRNYG